jgi:hypothetical protein
MGDTTTDQAGKKDDDGGSKDAPRTFTQAELDTIIGQRIARERSNFADYDDLKAAKTELDQIKDANASELEKAVKAAKAEGISEATTRADQRIVAAAARALAAAAGFHEPKDAPRLLDLSKVKVNADGEADEDAIQAIIKAEVEKRAYLVKSDDKDTKRGMRRDPGQGARTGEKPSGREAGMAEIERRFPKRVTT